MWKPAVPLFVVIIIGVFGYQIIEDMSFLDSLYMTVITIFTVGFKEVKDLTPQGQIFTIFVILGGAGTALFAFTKIGEIVFEGGVEEFWRRRKMERELNNLKNHYIVCGFGRMGRLVSERLEEEKLPFVVIENNPSKIEEIRNKYNYLFIDDDAKQEDTLNKAGIKKAKALASLLPSDADNLYLVLTVRQICPSVFVLSKALDDEAEKKILQIGANKVVSPYKLSGLKIAQGLIRPTLVDFVDLIIRRKELTLAMEELVVGKDSTLVNKTLIQANIRKKANVIIIAVKKPGKDIVFNPAPSFPMEAGDTLLVLGNTEAINTFEATFL